MRWIGPAQPIASRLEKTGDLPLVASSESTGLEGGAEMKSDAAGAGKAASWRPGGTGTRNPDGVDPGLRAL